MNPLRLMVTLWPSFPHFSQFATDERLAGIRLNSAMIDYSELGDELKLLQRMRVSVPLYFDIKGQQLRVEEVHANPNYLDITLNHPIELDLRRPQPVLFKAGEDGAMLVKITEHGKRLIFDGGPNYNVMAGESLHIRHPSLKVTGPVFTNAELQKIDMVRKAGFTKYFLSYVEDQRMVDEFRDLVGRDSEIMLKIESKKGLNYVATEFRKQPHLTLVAARGDLYVEVDRPHHVIPALKQIIEKDPEAVAGSRLLLSLVPQVSKYMFDDLKRIFEKDPKDHAMLRLLMARSRIPIPSCADFGDLAWMYDIGYRNIMLCDELCLEGELLDTAVSVFDAFRTDYDKPMPVVAAPANGWKDIFPESLRKLFAS